MKFYVWNFQYKIDYCDCRYFIIIKCGNNNKNLDEIYDEVTFDGNFLFASSRMCEKIHLNTDFSNWAFLCASSIWNFIKNKLDFIYKFKILVTTREKKKSLAEALFETKILKLNAKILYMNNI